MLARIATLSLTLAVITACDRQEPQEPPRTPPPVGEAAETGYPTHAPDAPGMQARQPAPAHLEDPVGDGQHYDEGSYRGAFGERGPAMTDEQRDAALRECQRLQGENRERCEQEVHERSNPEPMQRD